MTTTDASISTPFHLTGNYTPVPEETTARHLPVTGQVPEGLRGSFIRNGPNPATGTSPHWFFGDGMVHGVQLDEGRATSYRSRWVQTTTLTAGATTFGSDGKRDLTAGKANTHVVRHAGRILALDESALPYELTDDLATVGPYDFAGRLHTPMTAHPKICPTTGEMHFFGYGYAPPYLTYHVADAAGRLVTSREVEVPGATMMHDFNLTEQFVVFMDLPVVFDLDLAIAGTMPYRFDPAYGARLGVLRRDDPRGPVRWFDIDPCYVFHPVNAHDDGTTITVDVIRYPELWTTPGSVPTANLWRWMIDLTTGCVAERQLDDRPCEFPRVDDRLVGQRADRAWVTTMADRDNPRGSGSITVYDLNGERSTTYDLGSGRVPGEAVFAPATDRAGGPGWLLTYVYDTASDSSEMIVLDADDVAAGPVATVHLPTRVPFGFHGSWLAEDSRTITRSTPRAGARTAPRHHDRGPGGGTRWRC